MPLRYDEDTNKTGGICNDEKKMDSNIGCRCNSCLGCMGIGGAYGVSGEMHARANQIISLSKLVFPHQLVRLILTEQFYRAQSITSGGKYHHE